MNQFHSQAEFDAPLDRSHGLAWLNIAFVTGFGPVVSDTDQSRRFWETGIGIELTEAAPGYFASDSLDGVKAFALWALSQAAESTFGTRTWPDGIRVPQAWLEVDIANPEEVSVAVRELEEHGHQVVRGAATEPWGQVTSRVLSPEGLLVGVAYTPWMHSGGAPTENSPLEEVAPW